MSYSVETWQQRYASADYAYGREPNDFLKSEVSRIPRGRILCIGEGEGRNAVFLARQGFQVTAVDGSSNGLDKARRLARESGVEIETTVADLAVYEIGICEWQGIVSIFVHLPDPLRELVHRRVVAGLAAGGAFVLEAYTPRQLEFRTGGPSELSRLAGLDALQRELRGLSFEIGREVERVVKEGTFHSGMSATVQIVARKE
ncbi:MAG TPA: class I SAM-dependent methyltransferase [Fimbriimonadaceae bacterium]|nr:class I SAM-dependent methyltransferase [Fimbriimonadaceae bacterium]